MTGNFPIIEELRMRGRALGLDMGEIGRRCGLAETSLRAWEKGKAAPSPDALERWAKALGFRIALLPMDTTPQRGISVDWKQQRIALRAATLLGSSAMTTRFCVVGGTGG